MEKIDLVMWTLNGESTLPYCLKSVEDAIPYEVVGKKFVIDAHSVDDTRKICEFYGWNVFDAEHIGIPFQANQALKMVESKLFASFEQDIILHPCWFKFLIKRFNNENIGVVQGARVSVHPVLGAIDRYYLERNIGYSSLDNTIYRTELIRNLGGFDERLMSSMDRDLQSRLRCSGKKWIVDHSIISRHLHSSLRSELQHQKRIVSFSHGGTKFGDFKRLLFSPLRGLDIMVKQRCPFALFYYPLLRLAKFRGLI